MISSSYIVNRIRVLLIEYRFFDKIKSFSQQMALAVARGTHASSLLMAALFLLTLTACGPSYIFEETKPIAEDGWSYNDTLNFNFEIVDTSTIYDLHLILDHKDDFASQNTYVRLKLRFPDGKRTDEQLSLQMADAFGVWLGDCRGENCSLDIPIQTGAYFSQSGNYQLTVEQFSRAELLYGITALTFALEERIP
ncbi:MAG: gliding motility lipoprotein GldH [Bacteroidota bacterium]